MRAFFAVPDLERARSFYDLLFQTAGQVKSARVAYLVEGFQLDFYLLTPEQSQEFQLEPGPSQGCGLCLTFSGSLEKLEEAGGHWVRPMGPSQWGDWMAHLQDPFGYRWELIQKPL